MEHNDEYNNVVRHHNRALRKVHKHLRRALKNTQEYSDELFLLLCDKDAEIALEKLWTLGRMEDKCGPRDYDKIVEVCLAALNVTMPID